MPNYGLHILQFLVFFNFLELFCLSYMNITTPQNMVLSSKIMYIAGIELCAQHLLLIFSVQVVQEMG